MTMGCVGGSGVRTVVMTAGSTYMAAADETAAEPER
jgi:hypothetical protein